MHKLYDIKDMLMEELESNADSKLTAESLKEIDTLAHALKNVCKILENCENEYSERGYARDYARGFDANYSGRRDSMGRYARDEAPDMSNAMRGMSRAGNNEHVVHQLEQLMATAADDRTRGKFRELIRDMRNA